jgi:hypothetical protein
MSESNESVIFFGDGVRLMLDASGYQRPSATDLYDANWLNSTVSITAGPFSGSFNTNLSTYDFVKLQEQLEELVQRLSGRLDFETTENDLVLSVEFSHRGTAAVSGLLRPGGSEATTLSFRLETDQSALSETVRQLKGLLRRLPVREPQG